MLTGVEDPHHYYADLGFLRIQIRLSILMRVGIWILTRVMRICDHWHSDLTALFWAFTILHGSIFWTSTAPKVGQWSGPESDADPYPDPDLHSDADPDPPPKMMWLRIRNTDAYNHFFNKERLLKLSILKKVCGCWLWESEFYSIVYLSSMYQHLRSVCRYAPHLSFSVTLHWNTARSLYR